MTILVTGSAGFIGNAVAKRLLEQGERVVGLDNLTPYYDVNLKKARLARIAGNPGFIEARIALQDRQAMAELFRRQRFSSVIHLAAQAGVRYSLTNPWAYVESNLNGFVNILEGCRQQAVEHLVFASSSSVYGANAKMPFSEHDSTEHPVSLYAATKKANELMAHAYSHLYRIPCTGLRFFTVYGPWGRPDMVLFLFSEAILSGKPIQVFNHGEMRRDFTYIDDVVEGVIRVTARPPAGSADWSAERPDPASSAAPYRLYNIGNHNPVELNRMIQVLEEHLGRRAERENLPIQLGEVPATFADVGDLERDTGFRPSTPIEQGVARFVAWYREYYKV
jgi:UDP-glucuronate 4-epimerase